ncbi:MAG: MBOAT family O-acyltransferase, partial [Oscillospiraceae bacterium]|nr:MBOAT family O-acyltransferase [Oscillospiraceae bacterium]
TFFRDYVYIPLGGSRRGLPRTLLNLLVVWALTGLWHGAKWTFVLWGLYYFVFLALEKLFLRRLLEKLPSPISWLYTSFVVFMGWVIFKFTDAELLVTAAKGLFGLNGNPLGGFQVELFLQNRLFLLLVSALVCTPFFTWLGGRISSGLGDRPLLGGLWTALTGAAVPVALLLLSTAMLVGGSYNPFIYFQF